MNTKNLKSFNINNEVSVKLSEDGKKYLKEYFSKDEIHRQYLEKAVELKGDVLTMQLWELMRIFGPQMYNGNSNSPFQSTNILMSESDIKDVKKRE